MMTLISNGDVIHLCRTIMTINHSQGHFRKLPDLSGPKYELALQQLSPGMAMLALHCWLADLR